MARKRMISPEIWENEGFGELSLLAKLLFIGMISQADDDGKGVLSPKVLKSKIFPYDEIRIADINKALNEIGHQLSTGLGSVVDTNNALNERDPNLSVVFYDVDGKHYYKFEKWKKWQTINRPTPSKLPNPPVADGEGGGVRSCEVFSDNSVSTHTQFSEYSHTNKKEEDENNIITHTQSARSAREEDEFSVCDEEDTSSSQTDEDSDTDYVSPNEYVPNPAESILTDEERKTLYEYKPWQREKILSAFLKIHELEEKEAQVTPEQKAKEFERNYKAFIRYWGIKEDNYSGRLSEFDFEKLDQMYKKSKKFLQCTPCCRVLSWIDKNYESIIAGKYTDKDTTGQKHRSGG